MKITDEMARQVARLVGCSAADVQEILEHYTQPLAGMSAEQIAGEITRRLDELARNP